MVATWLDRPNARRNAPREGKSRSPRASTRARACVLALGARARVGSLVVETVVAALCGVRDRAWRALPAVLGACALVVLGAGTARAQVTLPSDPVAPLEGSMFQGGDGNQEDLSAHDPPYVDWQGFEESHRVVHSAYTGLQFGSGSREGSPGEWSLEEEGDGVNPAKDNILDAWSAVDQPGPNTFLYPGFTREKALGTTTIAFELNQDARTWDNDNNPATPAIPCRRTGDVLIVFDAHGSDPSMDVHSEKWVTETTESSTGCARTGHLTAVATTKGPVDYGQGSSNPGPVTSRLPGHFPPGTQIPEARLFGEAALNLTQLFFDPVSGGSCFSFASIWMHSRASVARASNDENSRMKDYLAPHPLVLNSCAAAGTKFADLNADGRRDAGEPGLAGFLTQPSRSPRPTRTATTCSRTSGRPRVPTPTPCAKPWSAAPPAARAIRRGRARTPARTHRLLASPTASEGCFRAVGDRSLPAHRSRRAAISATGCRRS